MTSQLSLLTAVLDGRRAPLVATLRGLPVGDASPFARVPGTHNGRFTVVSTEPAPAARFRAGGLPAPLLMCSGTIDTEPGRWVTDLLEVLGPAAGTIWGHCAGWAAATDKVAYLLGHAVPSTLQFVTWDAPVGRVRAALAARRRATALAVRAQHMSDAALVAAYRTEFR